MYEKFEELLKNRGLTITDVSKGAGVSRSTIYEWRSGVHVPNQKNLMKLAEYLGVTVDYFLYDDEVDQAWEEHKHSVDNMDVNDLLDMIANNIFDVVDAKHKEEYKNRMKHYSDYLLSEMTNGNEHND